MAAGRSRTAAIALQCIRAAHLSKIGGGETMVAENKFRKSPKTNENSTEIPHQPPETGIGVRA